MNKQQVKRPVPKLDINTNPIWDVLKKGDRSKKKKKKKKMMMSLDQEINLFFSELEEKPKNKKSIKKPTKKTSKKVERRRWSFSLFQGLIAFSAFLIVLFFSLIYVRYDILKITTNNMSTTLDKTNQVLYQKDLSMNRFNIVIVEREGEKDVLRVIGMPGDSVTMKDDLLTINSSEYDEIYLKRNFVEFKTKGDTLNQNYTSNFDIADLSKQTIPQDKYFLLGDNRLEAFDSRKYGYYDASEIEGVVLMKIRPFSELGPLE